MPELTVAMPTRNVARYLSQAIESVLWQQGVDFQLVVVNDGSIDETQDVLDGFHDPRIRVLRNETPHGIGFCHNQIIRKTTTPLITHVDSDDILLPGALAAVMAKIRESDNIGQVHSPHCFMGDPDNATLPEFRFWYRYWERHPVNDYKKEMLAQGMVMNTLRTYRREVFSEIGGFSEAIKYAVDWEMGVRLLDKFQVARIEHCYYMVRQHNLRTSTASRYVELDYIWKQLRIATRLRLSGRVGYLGTWRYNPYKIMVMRLFRMLSINRLWRIPTRRMVGMLSTVKRNFGPKFYEFIQKAFCRWPAEFFRQDADQYETERIAYYLWKYPSTTFVQREVEALAVRASVEVFADAPGDHESSGMHLQQGTVRINYRLPGDPFFLSTQKRFFLSRHPLRFINLFWFTIVHRYAVYKTFAEDCAVFSHAVYLAGMLRERKITHLHAPWADRNAFICLLASRLLGINYSVQIRAHELHRKRARYALWEKLSYAKFVVTNAHYNREYIYSYLPRLDPKKVNIIYEGVDPERVRTGRPTVNYHGKIEILCVARLIEEKGVINLLRAGELLRHRNLDFRIRIIGGREDPTYTNYYVNLMRLHRRQKLQSHVKFCGFQPFQLIMKALRTADIFVLPCVHSENGGQDITPNSIIEAMAMGLPVVSSNVGGIPELVDNEINGILTQPGEIEQLADALELLCVDIDYRKRLGENARKKVESNFDIHKNIESYLSLFRSINPLAN